MDNIILIGMPAVGKSTVGVIVAKRLGYNFVDTDLVMTRWTACAAPSTRWPRGWKRPRR